MVDLIKRKNNAFFAERFSTSTSMRITENNFSDALLLLILILILLVCCMLYAVCSLLL
jgi:hypothetical protein